MRREDPRRHGAQQWLAKAAEDLGLAELLVRGSVFPSAAVFHCQQAVEKALKAFLFWHDRPFRRTHDLVEIGGRCVTVDPALEPLLRRTAPLTEYAWKFRYPGEGEPSQAEAQEALSLAREVYEAILARLPQEVRP